MNGGLVLIDKPAGISSFGALRILRRRLGIKKVGHAGTLDPLATGLLVTGVGKGTKQLASLVKLDKEYIAVVRIGESRTTGDLEGRVVAECSIEKELSDEQISMVLQSMVGVVRLPVSAYSAIKVDGVPMYHRARKAEKIGLTVTDVPMRDMKVYEAELLSVESYVTAEGVSRLHVTVRFFVGSGTYIRSLGEEMGRRLGYPACLASLRRTKVGMYDVAGAIPPEEVTTENIVEK